MGFYDACRQSWTFGRRGRETPGSAASILGAISHAGVNIEMISLGASNIAIDVIVRGQDKEAAVRAVHEAFLKDGEAKERFPWQEPRQNLAEGTGRD